MYFARNPLKHRHIKYLNLSVALIMRENGAEISQAMVDASEHDSRPSERAIYISYLEVCCLYSTINRNLPLQCFQIGYNGNKLEELEN